MTTRTERDSLGEVEVPADALYGAQTQRAVNNFPISGQALPAGFISALIHIKGAAAAANKALGTLPAEQADAITGACQDLLQMDNYMQHFPVDVFQTGSGTSSNMNANEVIATLASRICSQPVHPNDHVNLGQSSNDVIPSAIHLSAAIALQTQLLPALQHLQDVLQSKRDEIGDTVKTGRTHLMDAMPVTFGQVLDGWAAQMQACSTDLQAHTPALHGLALGGTAVGTGVNAHAEFASTVCRLLSTELGLQVRPADNYFAAIGSQDTAVALSGSLKALAVGLTKIANDLRWMNSGPLAGLGEISLQALQPGSSIMPGKVNPVIAEAACMVAAQVIGNDAAITIGGQAGNFELNVMLPVIASNLLHSIELLGNMLPILGDKAIATFTVNHQTLQRSLHLNPILVTALNPIIGYKAAAQIAQQAYQQQRPILDVAVELTDIAPDRLKELLDPQKLTQP